ncbi:MAG: hypothetical protein ACODAG_04295 [Myxococcota bacterium]
MTIGIPAGLDPRRRRICEVALAELGTRERPHASNRGPVEKYFPAWKRRRLEQQDAAAGRKVRGPAWCAFFTTWCWQQALEEGSPVGHIGSVHRCATRARDGRRWVDFGGGFADAEMLLGMAPGDAFVMLDRPLGYGSSGHIGIILRVSEDGLRWVTVEGNTGHAVRLGLRRADQPRMRGVISVLGDLGTGDWETGLGDLDGVEDVTELGTR